MPVRCRCRGANCEIQYLLPLFSHESLTGTTRTYLGDIANSLLSTAAVVACGDYACSDGYEYKDSYSNITCTDNCDDDQCCDLGGCGLSKRYMVPTYVLYQCQMHHSALGVGSLLQGRNQSSWLSQTPCLLSLRFRRRRTCDKNIRYTVPTAFTAWPHRGLCGTYF